MASRSNPESDPGNPRLLSGEAWRELCSALRRAERLVRDEPGGPRDHAEGYRHLTRFLAAGIASCVAHDDGDHPHFGRMIDYAMPWGLDNPDCLYLYAGIRGDRRYRIHGHRGSARHIDVQVNYGHFASGDIASWGTLASVDGFDLETDADGCFELILEPQPGAGGGNRLPLAPSAEFVLVRQYFADWEGERPADLLIERLDGGYPAPPPRSDRVAAQLDRLTSWLERGGALWREMSRGLLSMEPNTLVVHRPDDAGERAGLRGQAYGMGNFRCGPDEAVVVELEPPRCHYWGISLANRYWECIEYATRQSSLNSHQARLDSDGVFRGVIAHADPGVPNWLDTAGHERGTLALRFLHADAAPKPALRVVPFADLRAALPEPTPRVGPDERAASLEQRRRAVWRRFRH